jgi:hypothetical protein
MSALGLVADEDDDGNAASRPPKQEAKPIPYDKIRAELEEKVVKPRRKSFIEEAIGRDISTPAELTEEECALVTLALL